MQVLFAHLVYCDCSKIKMIIFWFPTYVRGDFDGLKSTGFLAESHLFALNTLRLVYWMEKNTNNWLHHSFVANDASFGTLPFRTLSYLVSRCLQQILFLFYQPSVELELWKRFHVFKKVRNISRFDWDRQSRMRDYHLSLHALRKVKTNQPRASQICILSCQ